jgi:hypothetical protein
MKFSKVIERELTTTAVDVSFWSLNIKSDLHFDYVILGRIIYEKIRSHYEENHQINPKTDK